MSENSVTGLAELQALLDQLPVKLERNVLRGAMRAGAKVQLEAAKAAVPVDSGTLRKSLKIRTSARRGVVKATLTAGDKKAFYARFVEFGTAAHWIKPKNAKALFFGLFAERVHNPGAKPKPFMRPALDGTVQAATAAAGAYIRARLTKEGIELPDPGDGAA